SNSDTQNSLNLADDLYSDNSDNNIENIDSSLIQNLIIHFKKGVLRKTRFKGSQKIKKKVVTKKPTECQQCHRSGYNKA
ncbi:15616_t:CDS:1, partial [Racocetra persica]